MLGLANYMDVMKLPSVTQYVPPTSDENVAVTDTEFSGVAVRLFLPKKPTEGLRRAMLFFHGGGFCLGDAGELSCRCQSLHWRFRCPIGSHSRGSGAAFQQDFVRKQREGLLQWPALCHGVLSAAVGTVRGSYRRKQN